MKLTDHQLKALRRIKRGIEKAKKLDPGYTGGLPLEHSVFLNASTLKSLLKRGLIQLDRSSVNHSVYGEVKFSIHMTP